MNQNTWTKVSDILKYFIAPLAAAILAALFVHYLPPPKQEKMFYSTEPINFAGSNSQLYISSIGVTNAGDSVATALQGEITFPNSQIKDRAVTSASGAEHELKTILETSNAYHFTLARLIPRDGLKFSFVVDPPGTEPIVTIRSGATVAMKGPDPKQGQNQGHGTHSTIFVRILAALFILLILVLAAYAYAYRSSHPKPRQPT